MILQDGRFVPKKWQDIKLGQIVKVQSDEFFPADMILINSSEDNGMCYVETKNLDGETSLKFKQSPVKIADLFNDSNEEESLYHMTGTIECKPPNEFIYEFNAKLTINESIIIPIDKNSFLLRGCSLRQTQFIYGLVTYVGHQTKIMKNSPSARHKTSKIEDIMNIQIAVIFCLQLILSLTGAIINVVWVQRYNVSNNTYL